MNLLHHGSGPTRGARAGRLLAAALALTAAAVSLPVGIPATAGERAPDATPQRAMSTPFRVATFNVLGASHTRTDRRGFDDYRPRMRRTIRLIDAQQFSIVGFQEFQIEQFELFRRRVDGAWAVWPGLDEGRRPVQNSIVWRTEEWEMVDNGLFEIPYFRGVMVPEPYVKLRNLDSGHTVWVMNTHNPANSKGEAQRFRDQAIDIEAGVIETLHGTGVPLLFTGDFNDRDDAFCRLTSQAPVTSVSGGSYTDGVCHTPPMMRIDWIFRTHDVGSANYTVLDTAQTQAITDHKVIYADVSLPSS